MLTMARVRLTIAPSMTTGTAVHDWLPGPLTVNAMPLSAEELKQLYASNLALTGEDVEELSLALPYLGDVLSPEQFRVFVRTKMAIVRGPGVASGKERTVAAVADLCGSSSARVVADLRRAVNALSPEDYEKAYRRLAELTKKRGAFRRRAALIGRLAQGAPNWAAAVAARDGVHGGASVPGDAVAAWEWMLARQGRVFSD